MKLLIDDSLRYTASCWLRSKRFCNIISSRCILCDAPNQTRYVYLIVYLIAFYSTCYLYRIIVNRENLMEIKIVRYFFGCNLCHFFDALLFKGFSMIFQVWKCLTMYGLLLLVLSQDVILSGHGRFNTTYFTTHLRYYNHSTVNDVLLFVLFSSDVTMSDYKRFITTYFPQAVTSFDYIRSTATWPVFFLPTLKYPTTNDLLSFVLFSSDFTVSDYKCSFATYFLNVWRNKCM